MNSCQFNCNEIEMLEARLHTELFRERINPCTYVRNKSLELI